MSPKKQRIAIAEACPLVFEANKGRFAATWSVRYVASGSPCDPLTNLNAMHEAEKVLTDDQQRTFIRYLVQSDRHFEAMNKLDSERFSDRENVVAKHLCRLGWDEVWCYCLRATAAQRAEAFLKTLNLWEKLP